MQGKTLSHLKGTVFYPSDNIWKLNTLGFMSGQNLCQPRLWLTELNDSPKNNDIRLACSFVPYCLPFSCRFSYPCRPYLDSTPGLPLSYLPKYLPLHSSSSFFTLVTLSFLALNPCFDFWVFDSYLHMDPIVPTPLVEYFGSIAG